MKHLDFSSFRLMMGGVWTLAMVGLMPIACADQVLPVPVAPASLDNPSSQIIEAQPPSLADGWREPELVRSLTGHVASIDTLAFSPDGKILLSGGSTNDGQIKLWWLRSGREIESLRAHRMSVMGLLFSQDGKTLASVGDDGGVNLWRWKTGNFDSAMGAYTRTFLDHTSNLLAMAMTPDSQTLVTGGLDGIRVWDLRSQRPLYNMVRFDNQTYSLAVNPNGDILASGHKFGSIKLWSLSNGTPLGSISAHTRPANPVSALAFTPDGRILVSGSYDRTIKVWDITRGQLMHVLRGHAGRIQSIAINPDGETLASASRDGVRLWNLRTGELLTVLTGHQDWVRSVAFSPDGTTLATGGFDRKIMVWRLPTNPDR